jgi:hypothetical protein
VQVVSTQPSFTSGATRTPKMSCARTSSTRVASARVVYGPGERVAPLVSDGHRVILRVIYHNRLEDPQGPAAGVVHDPLVDRGRLTISARHGTHASLDLACCEARTWTSRGRTSPRDGGDVAAGTVREGASGRPVGPPLLWRSAVLDAMRRWRADTELLA